MQYSNKRCIYCGEKLNSSAQFCSKCGRNQTIQKQVVQVEEKQLDGKTKWKTALVRSVFVLVLSVILIACAFLPIMTTTHDTAKIKDVKVSYSAIDSITYFVDSLQAKRYSALSKTEIFNESENIYNYYIERRLDDTDYNILGKTAQAKVSRYVKLEIRLYYQTIGNYPSASLIASAVLSIAYLATSAALLIYSLINLLALLKKVRISPHKAWMRTVNHLFALPMLAISIFIALGLTFGTVYDYLPAVGLYLLIALIVVGFIALMIFSAVMKDKANKLKVAPRLAAIAVALSVVVSLFLPVMTSEVKTIFSGRSVANSVDIQMGADFYNDIDYSANDIKEYENFADKSTSEILGVLNRTFDKFSDYTVNEVAKGEADEVNSKLIIQLSSTQGLMQFAAVFAQLPLLYVIICLTALAIIWQNTVYLITGSYDRGSVIASKIVTFFVALVAFAIIIVYYQFLIFYIGVYISSKYALSIGVSSILLIIMAFAGLFIPTKVVKKEKLYDGKYQNKDYIKEEFGI